MVKNIIPNIGKSEIQVIEIYLNKILATTGGALATDIVTVFTDAIHAVVAT